jgi:YfiR/HmsC-like
MNTFTIRTLMLVAAAFYLVVARAGSADEAPPGANYTIHTLYIFNFTKYIEWPTGSKQVKIGVFDNPTAAEELQKMAKAKSTDAAEISIVNTRNENELSTCQIIFIPENNSAKTAALIQRFGEQPILIVTEESDMIEKGASISFKIADGKLRFQVNEKTIKAKGLKVSRTLVSLSEK